MTDTERLQAVVNNMWLVLPRQSGYVVLSAISRPVGSGSTFRDAIDNALSGKGTGAYAALLRNQWEMEAAAKKAGNTMKTMILFCAFSILSCASTLPNLGAPVLAIPGSTWQVNFCDQLGDACVDFNAAVGLITFEPDDTAVLDYVSTDSPNTDLLRIANPFGFGGWLFVGQSETFPLPIPELGQAVAVQMLDADFPYPQFSTGPGFLNPDGYPHAVVTELGDGVTAAPEPGTWGLMLVGLGVVARQRARAK